MVERSRGLRLAAEPRLKYLVPGQVGAQRLDRDDPVEPDVTGPIHLGHAATAHHAIKLVAATE
jgi:hypothetical protein